MMNHSLRAATVADLIDAARADRPEAFDEIVRRFRSTAQASAYWMLRDTQLAQDVAQEAFVDAFLGLEKLRDPAAFAGWFRSIVFKHADRVRRRSFLKYEMSCETSCDTRDTANEFADPAPGPEARLLAARDRVSVVRVVDRLPEHERVVVGLFYAADQSHAEIGEHLGLPRSTIKKRLHDARRRMRDQLVGLDSFCCD